jgi:hypothetical protein
LKRKTASTSDIRHLRTLRKSIKRETTLSLSFYIYYFRENYTFLDRGIDKPDKTQDSPDEIGWEKDSQEDKLESPV